MSDRPRTYVEMFYDSNSESVRIYGESDTGKPCLDIPAEALKHWALLLLAIDNAITKGPIMIGLPDADEPDSAQGWFGTLSDEA